MSETHRCGGTVKPSGGLRLARGFPCGAKAKVQRDRKWYCLRHDPMRVDERQAKARAEADIRYAVKWDRIEESRKAANDKLIEKGRCVGLREAAALCEGRGKRTQLTNNRTACWGCRDDILALIDAPRKEKP